MTKKFLQLIAIAMLFSAPWAMNAQNSMLTICDGTSNHEYVPFYGYYADESQHNQMIYPADSLTDMVGEAIMQMVFYIDQSADNGSNTAASILGTWTVSLGETTSTTLNGLDNSTTLTQVYQGYFDCSTGTLTLLFDSPYSYNGGNLLVDIVHPAASYNRWYFLGVNATGASYCYDNQRNFLPKVKFTYGAPPTCIRPTGLQATVNNDTVNVSWSDDESSAWDIVWGPSGFNPDTVVVNIDMVSNTSHQITGLTVGMWQAYVRANCGSETSLWLGPINFGIGIYNMATSGSDTLRTCGSVIYDDGGATANYSANCQSTLVLLPGQPGYAVKVNGTSYTESSWDYLTIYGGIGTSGEELWSDYGVSQHQNFGPFISEAITIVFHSDGSVQYEGFEINVMCEPIPTCTRPDSLIIVGVDSTEVTLSWVDPSGSNWAVAYGPTGFTLGDENTMWADFNLTTGTVGNLNPGMKYDFYLMSVCGSNEGDTSWTRMVSTYTACAAIHALPYMENFDGLEPGYNAAFNPCWTKGNNYISDYPYVYNDSYSDITSNFLYFYTSSYNNSNEQQWAVMPAVGNDIEMNTLELSFTAYPYYHYSGYSHNLLIGVIDSSAYDINSMTIDTIAIINPTVEQNYYISFANYEGLGKNIIFLHWLDGNSNTGYIGLDNINLYLLPQCDRPDSLMLTNADSTSLSLSWWASDNSSDFYVEWRPANSIAYTSDDASSNSYTIQNLTPNTLYDVRVRTVCGDDTSIAVIGQYRTSCLNVNTFPYTEGFETNSYLCWQTYNFDGYDGDNWLRYNYNSHSGSWCFYSSYNGSTIGTNWLVSAPIEIPAEMTAATLSWYISGGAYMGTQPHYAVKVSSTSSTDTTAFTTLLEEDRNDMDENSYTYYYYKRSVSLAQYAGQTIYIAFVRHTRDDNGLYLDDIKIEQVELPEISIVGTSAPVTALSTTYIAHLDGGQATGLTWNWQSARATAGNATMTTISSDTITMLYPTTGTDTIRLIGTNAFGSDTAYLVINPITIAYSSLPYSSGFEPTDDTTWTISNGPNGWHIDTAAHATGNYSLYISSDNGATNGYAFDSNSESFAYKAFNFDTPGQYGINFDWRAMGESCCDYLMAYLVPASETSMVGSSSFGFSVPGSWRQLANSMNDVNTWQNTSIIFNLDVAGVYYICFRWHNDGSLGSNPAAAIDNIEIMQITCPAPSSLVIDSIANTSATFHWSPLGSESSWQVQVGSLAPVTVNDTIYTATGLTHATNYSVKVRAICGAGDTSLSLSSNFWTECNDFTVPYYIHFDGYNGLNVCWSTVTSGGTTPSPSWLSSSTYGNDYIYSNAPSVANPTSDYLISPAIQIPTGDTTSLRLVLRMAGGPSTYYTGSVGAYQVLVSPTGADSIAAFTDVLLNDTLNSTTFDYRRIPMGAYAGQTVRIAIRNVSRTYGQVAIYDFGVRYTNAPLYFVSGNTIALAGDTNNFTATHEEGDTNTMTLSWTSTMAAAGQATIMNANTESMQIVYNAAGVDSITFIASNNFGADTTTLHVTVYQCDLINTFPYIEGFELDNPCWLKVYADGNPSVNTMGVTSDVGYSLPGTHGGNSIFRFSSYSTTSDYTQYLISPELGGGNLVLSFWAATYGSGDHLWLGYSTTTRDTAAFTWGNELVLSTDNWTEIVDTLPAGTKFIAFRYWGDYAFYSYLDDLTINGVNICAMPVITDITPDESSLTVNYTSDADSVEMKLCQGVFNENTPSVYATGGSYTFTGLNHSTLYTLAVRALCSAQDASEWVVDTVRTIVVNCGVPTGFAVTESGYTSVTFGWNAAGDEHGWEVTVYNTLGNVNATSNTTSVTVSGLTASTTYSASVRALCGQNADIEGEWSEPIQFTTNVCAPVSDVTVTNISGTTADVSWTAPEGATGFRVLYGLHDFTQGEELGTYTANESQYHLTGLEITTDYTVRVANLCTETLVSQYASANFTTGTEGIATVDADGNLSIYPNPASSMVTISVSEQLTDATATIVDLNGRTVASFGLVNNTATIDVSMLAKGAYFVRITGEQATTVRKLIVK